MLGMFLFSSRNFDDWWNLIQSSWLKAWSKKKKTLTYRNREESESEVQEEVSEWKSKKYDREIDEEKKINR